MITITIDCSMCGEHLYDKKGSDEFYPKRSDDKPHYDLDTDMLRICKANGWVFESEVCGDVYCSQQCARGY